MESLAIKFFETLGVLWTGKHISASWKLKKKKSTLTSTSTFEVINLEIVVNYNFEQINSEIDCLWYSFIGIYYELFLEGLGRGWLG